MTETLWKITHMRSDGESKDYFILMDDDEWPSPDQAQDVCRLDDSEAGIGDKFVVRQARLHHIDKIGDVAVATDPFQGFPDIIYEYR